jgi:RNA polymerase sigma-70 factor, ECF subfamily
LNPSENELKDLEAHILKELMVRYQLGEASAADELVGRLNRTLGRYLYATSLGAPNLDDMLQECWLRIHKARSSYRPGEPVMPWVLAIARHTRIDSYRKWKRTSAREIDIEPQLEELGRSPQGSWDRAIAAERLIAVMKILPEAQREVVVMLKLTGMSIQEVALATGSTPAAVKQKAYRAYQSLRKELGLDRKEVNDEVL